LPHKSVHTFSMGVLRENLMNGPLDDFDEKWTLAGARHPQRSNPPMKTIQSHKCGGGHESLEMP
jgi:hypothetical protein